MKDLIARITGNAFLKNSIVLFLGTMFVNVLNYVFHLVIGRMATPVEYGEIESLISLLTIVSVGAGTLTMVATKYAAEMKGRADVGGTLMLSRYLNRQVLRFGLPLFVLLLLFTPVVQSFLKIEHRVAISLLFGAMFISFLSAVTMGLLSGWQRFADVNIINIASTVIKFVSAVLLISIGFGASGAVGGLVLAALLGYGISWWLLKRHVSKHSTSADVSTLHAEDLTRSVKGYVLPAFLGTLAMALFGNADMIFAKHHLDGAMTGEYGALSVVAKTIFFVTGVITTVLFAMAAESAHDRKQSRATFHLAVILTVVVSFGAVLLFSLFPTVVVGTLFGEKYVAVSPLLGWFALAAALYSLASLMMQYLLSLHETTVVYSLVALASLEIVSLFFFGATLYAIIGITIVTQIIALIIGVGFVVKSHRYVPIDLDRRPGL